MKRGDPWPRTLAAAHGFKDRMRQRYKPLVANLHTLDLLGLADAVTAEMKERRELDTAFEGLSDRDRVEADLNRDLNVLHDHLVAEGAFEHG